MKLADLKVIKERLSRKTYGSYEPPKDYGKTNRRAPKPSKCRVNSNCYDDGRFFMSDYGISY